MCLVLMGVVFGEIWHTIEPLNTSLLAFHGAIDTRFYRKKNGPSSPSSVYGCVSLANDIILDCYPLPALLSLYPFEYPKPSSESERGSACNCKQ